MTARTADPRPLTGEPLALDLLNTRWAADGEPLDLFAGAAGLSRVEGLAVWLESVGLAGRFRADAATLVHLLTAREALARAVADPADESARRLIDAVLEHGRIRATLTAEGPGERAEFNDPAWGPAWLAARDYLGLLASAPDRIRECASPACVLHFHDTSRNGTRRWCSMAACGNRAKASRHYARTRER
ncbi:MULTISPECIES: CGNR zinc finger domain-containing protein [unclassified Streptomyces]|uniref:CGNR zinc finger domain-containing protein n=1 Tax=unclassified Streptomyces TaxID=2593676 RepID=UPI00224E7E33|nr:MULTISPECIES: CGNR zinc finger domain-containing protein [unclassified Streptomyces]MCX4525888.1 CGNR zinc finger domain-containing protein [Streptomyces sp. NBC_01551]MCX4543550.1 CGNR zinc finger domain-containing protein [Streptomyces sp. NBC_01565]